MNWNKKKSDAGIANEIQRWLQRPCLSSASLYPSVNKWAENAPDWATWYVYDRVIALNIEWRETAESQIFKIRMDMLHQSFLFIHFFFNFWV